MWRYLAGVQPPAKKIKSNEKYEEKRMRVLQDSWKEGRRWLFFDGQTMFCSVCIEAKYTSSEFVKGCKSARLDSIRKHEESDIHKRASLIEENKRKEPGSRPAEIVLRTLNIEVTERLKHLFRTAHALAMNGRPCTDFVWQCQLDKLKGVDIGATYHNDKSCRQFIHAIALSERERLFNVIMSAKYAAILCDGSTDSGVIDNEIVYLRVVVKGQPQVIFIGCMQVQKADAQGVLDAMKRACELINIQWDDICRKLVAMGSDGASVMQGKKGGVAALLKKLNPQIISIHCLAHRLELAYKDAIKQIALGSKVVTILLMGLYFFYHNSPLNRSNLHNSYAALGMAVKVPTRVGGTRWIGHVHLALTNFMHGYPAILLHLSQVTSATGVQSTAKAKATCFLKLMKNDNILAFAALLHDVISALKIMSKVFQRREGSVADVHRTLESVLLLLKQYLTRDGPCLSKLKSGQLNCNLKHGTDLSNFNSSRNTLLNELIDTLGMRFADANEGVVKASIIADFLSWPNKIKQANEIEAFGETHITTLAGFYEETLKSAGVEIDDLHTEWSLLKNDVYKSHPDVGTLAWDVINRKFGSTYPNILSLIDLILTLPSSSSECERGFSVMKKVKTDTRNRLGESSLSDEMTIKLESKSIECFDPMPAIHLWNTKLPVLKRRAESAYLRKGKVQQEEGRVQQEEGRVQQEEGSVQQEEGSVQQGEGSVQQGEGGGQQGEGGVQQAESGVQQGVDGVQQEEGSVQCDEIEFDGDSDCEETEEMVMNEIEMELEREWI